MLYKKSEDGDLQKLDLYVRSGKNVFDGTRGSFTNAGLTSVAKSPYVTINGTAVVNGRAILTKSEILPAGTYTIFIRQDGGKITQAGTRNNIPLYLYKANNDTWITWTWYAEMIMYFASPRCKYTFTLTEDTRIILTTYNTGAEIYEDFVLAYNIVKGDGSNVPSVADYEFEAYNASKQLDLYVKDKDGNAAKIS